MSFPRWTQTIICRLKQSKGTCDNDFKRCLFSQKLSDTKHRVCTQERDWEGSINIHSNKNRSLDLTFTNKNKLCKNSNCAKFCWSPDHRGVGGVCVLRVHALNWREQTKTGYKKTCFAISGVSVQESLDLKNTEILEKLECCWVK